MGLFATCHRLPKSLSRDMQIVFGPMLVLIGAFLFLMGFISGRFILNRKNLGEAAVASLIEHKFETQHVLLNNITFQTDAGTTQIDHILVAETGIFIIETKNYSGWIFGNQNESHWTQVIYKKKFKFPNPIRQNYGHLKAIQSLFTLSDNVFFPVVVFTGNAELKSNFGPAVLYLQDLIPFLYDEKPIVFDERKMAYIVGRIEMKRMRRSLETDEYHLNSIRDRFEPR
jgi:hypothetical protein